MRPGIAAVEGEIVGIGDAVPHRRVGLKDLVGDAVALAIGDRLLLSVEAQLHLLAHVTGTRPAHQRLDLARLFRLVVEHPFLGLGMAGLHRSPRRLVDACDHDPSPAPVRMAELVGAAGFEPATWSTQNSRATRLRYAPAPPASIHGSLCPSKPRGPLETAPRRRHDRPQTPRAGVAAQRPRASWTGPCVRTNATAISARASGR